MNKSEAGRRRRQEDDDRRERARKRLETGKEDVVWFTAPETLEEEPEEDAGHIRSPFKFWHTDPTADKQEIDDEMSDSSHVLLHDSESEDAIDDNSDQEVAEAVLRYIEDGIEFEGGPKHRKLALESFGSDEGSKGLVHNYGKDDK